MRQGFAYTLFIINRNIKVKKWKYNQTYLKIPFTCTCKYKTQASLGEWAYELSLENFDLSFFM